MSASTEALQYPPLEVLPASAYMSACEVLCWIVYRRTIKKEVYYLPLKSARIESDKDIATLLHESVPPPRPPQAAIAKAEECLRDRIESGIIEALDGDDVTLPIIPRGVFRRAISISMRNTIEANAVASMDEWVLARQWASYRDVCFKTEQIAKLWPPNLSAASRQEAAELWMEEHFRRSETKPKRDATVAACCQATGVTVRVAKEAWAKQPVSLRLRKGQSS